MEAFLRLSPPEVRRESSVLSNLKPQDVPQLNLRDPFLREILEHWTTLNYREKNLDFNSMGIRHNSLIRIVKTDLSSTHLGLRQG